AIYDSADQKTLMKQVLRELNIDAKVYPPQGILGLIDRAKNRGLPVSRIAALGVEEPLRSIATRAALVYQARLRASDAADFGDLLALAVELLEGTEKPPPPGAQLHEPDPVMGLRRRFQHVVVDEYQDTNPVQNRLVELLSGRAELCVVGDDDQAIYGWRGADVSQILGFPERHRGCQIIRLEQNYRSTGHILGCADAVISKNRGRLGKTLWSELGDGEKVRVITAADEREEATLIAGEVAQHIADGEEPGEIAVFYRTHAQSRAIEEAFGKYGLRYAVYGGLRFFDRKEIKDLIAYLRLIVNPRADLDLERVVNTPARGVGKATVERLQTRALVKGVSLWELLCELPDEADAAQLGKAAVKRLVGFRELLRSLQREAEDGDLGHLAHLVLDRTGLREALSREDSVEATTRLENVQEFVGALVEFTEEHPEAGLADYLEQVSLATDADGQGADVGAVTLMTIHSAKGLEFDHVYLTGMEERVFPHARVLDEVQDGTRHDGLEEERRLAYVAVTRARRHLTMTWVCERRLYGQVAVSRPSRFLAGLPPQHAELMGSRNAAARGRPPPRPAPTRAPAWDDDIVYDDGYEQEARHRRARVDDEPAAEPPRRRRPAAEEGVPLYIGMSVHHRKFGEGEVLGWEGAGHNLKLVLRFPGAGTKTILARYCEPA
ncbi:MAG: 3'-5' exonuclease, partial [Nannocystaceae bacterium]